MLFTDTITASPGRPMPATHSLPCHCFNPSATASNKVAAVTSTVCATPSMSEMVTRQERTSMRGAYQFRFLFAMRIKEWLGIAERAIRIDHKSRHESDSLKLEWKVVRRR